MTGPEDKPRDEHFAALARIFRSGKYSDLEIICGTESYSVHKSIVCMQSEFFDLACRPDSFKEGEEGIVRSKASDSPGWDEDCDDPGMVKEMIHFFYHLNYLVEKNLPAAKTHSGESVTNIDGEEGGHDKADHHVPNPIIKTGHLVSHAKMYALGDKYGVPGLKAYALERFKESTSRYWDTADFADSIPITYRSTLSSDTDLREAAVDVIHLHTKELVKKPEIECSLAAIQGLAYSLYRKQLNDDYVWQKIRKRF